MIPLVEWRAHLQSGEMEGGVETLPDLADELYGHLRMEEYGPILSTSERAIGLTVSTDEPNAGQALRWAAEVVAGFEAALAEVGRAVGVTHVQVGLADD